MTSTRVTFFLGVLTLILLAAALSVGPTPIAPRAALAAAFGLGPADVVTIVQEIRAPRALAALLVGAALGGAGAALQGLLRNPLAEPGVLGVSATAALFAVTALGFGAPGLAALAATGGGLAATGALALAAARIASVTALILIGVGLSSFAGALMALVMTLAPNPYALAELVTWTLGSVENRSFADLALAAPAIGIGFLVLMGTRPALSALSLGEEAAAGVGLDVARARTAIVIGAGLAAGGAVALAGAVGFVGIVAGHLTRPLVGHDPGRALAPAALLGGALLVGADILVRLAPGDAELRLGVVAALLGAPAFVWIAAQRRGLDG